MKTIEFFAKKKKTYERLWLICIILGSLFVISFIFLIFILPDDVPTEIEGIDEFLKLESLIIIYLVLTALFIIGGVLMFTFAHMANKAYRKIENEYKIKWIEPILHQKYANHIDNLKYTSNYKSKNNQKALSILEAKATEMLPEAKKFESYDRIEGVINSISFISADLTLKDGEISANQVFDKTRAEGEARLKFSSTTTTSGTIFHGRVYTFDLKQSIDSAIYILEKKYAPKPVVQRKFVDIKLEWIEFNEVFRTYTTDREKALALLTPKFMETLMKIEKIHPGHLGFSFINQKMHFVIHQKYQTFGFRKFKPLDENHVLNVIEEDLTRMIDIIDIVKNNRKLY